MSELPHESMERAMLTAAEYGKMSLQQAQGVDMIHSVRHLGVLVIVAVPDTVETSRLMEHFGVEAGA